MEIESKKEEETKAEETKADGKEEGEVEELDYDETMEDLDLHPTGNIDEGEGAGARRLSVKAEKKQGWILYRDMLVKIFLLYKGDTRVGSFCVDDLQRLYKTPLERNPTRAQPLLLSALSD